MKRNTSIIFSGHSSTLDELPKLPVAYFILGHIFSYCLVKQMRT